ncbi:hypothetical protein CYMTET_48572 [Cymbomonas tetramitiformis]|uniref:Uncharacterized protein n=1 Tax=Cymbomonas tetramitiformis TaxID=36881 RepID=A0AAE0EVF9_9CHLO|nr:hypothetical protein CYMTET_48572 [Cymbomonas tetramitiformis]
MLDQLSMELDVLRSADPPSPSSGGRACAEQAARANIFHQSDKHQRRYTMHPGGQMVQDAEFSGSEMVQDADSSSVDLAH